jgi:hypothetical protein
LGHIRAVTGAFLGFFDGIAKSKTGTIEIAERE